MIEKSEMKKCMNNRKIENEFSSFCICYVVCFRNSRLKDVRNARLISIFLFLEIRISYLL